MYELVKRLRALGLRLLDPFLRDQREREMAEELDSLLTLHTDEGLKAGLTPAEARRQAMLKLGGIEAVKENYRDQRSLPRLEHLVQDVRHAARLLARSPAFTLIAIVTLALGISANAAMFQLLDAVGFRALPIEAPERLAEIRLADMSTIRGNVSIWHAGATNAIWQEIRQRQHAFSGVFAWSGTGAGLSSSTGDPRFASVLLVSGEFFDVLGVRPHIGRAIGPADDQPGCAAPAAVISHGFWQSEFGSDPNVIGRSIDLDRYPFEIVGVTPREFTGLEVGRRFDVAVPLCAEALPPGSRSRLDSGVDWFLIVMGRLRPGMMIAQAGADLAAISPQIFEASLPSNYPAENVSQYRALQLQALAASSGISSLREQYSASLWLLQATAALVLMVGCVNLANLMLARFTARERDVAVRVALGAGRARLVQTLLAESLLLSAIAAIAGSWLAPILSGFLVSSIDPRSNTVFLNLAMEWRLIAATAITSIVAAALLGLIPAWRSTRVPPDAVLRSGGRGLTEGKSRIGVRQILVTSQVALSFVLLTGALLFGRTLNNLATQDLGLRPDGVTVSYVNLARIKIQPAGRAAFKSDLLRRLEETPGVISVAETGIVPLSGSASDNEVWAEQPGAPHAVSLFMTVSGRYFETMQVPLVAGRTFDDARDTPARDRVALVNESFARQFFAGVNPVGRRFRREAQANAPITSFEIVGVAKDTKYQHLREPQRPLVYLPMSQQPAPATFAQLLIRTSLDRDAAIETLKTSMKQYDPEIVPTFQDLGEMVGAGMNRDRLVAQLSGFFGGLAVLLSTLGLYGVMSFTVTRRTKEIGICMALGASAAGVAKTIIAEAVRLVLAGCAAGLVLSLLLARYVNTLVFGVSPTDPATLAAAGLLLMIVALIASGLPARRAVTLDPLSTLRAD